MQIYLPGNLAPPLAIRAAAPVPWAVNQILTAQVIGQPGENYTRLEIAGRAVTARTDLPLIPGRKIALRVAETGPTIVLKVIGHGIAPEPTPIDRALARILPAQSTLAETIHLMREFGAQVHLRRAAGAAPAAVRERITEFLRALPLAREASSPDTLRRAVNRAATPTEAKLIASTAQRLHPDLAVDLRWQLMRVNQPLEEALDTGRTATVRPNPALEPARAPVPARQLRASPPEQAVRSSDGAQARLPEMESAAAGLRQMVDGAIARVQANHLQNLPTPSATPVPLVVELPIARGTEVDLLRFEYEPDADAGKEGGEEALQRAKLTVSLHLDQGRDFTAEIRLAGSSMNIRVGSSDADMHAMIERRLDALRKGIERHGFDLSQLLVGPVAIRSAPRSIAKHLVNERA